MSKKLRTELSTGMMNSQALKFDGRRRRERVRSFYNMDREISRATMMRMTITPERLSLWIDAKSYLASDDIQILFSLGEEE